MNEERDRRRRIGVRDVARRAGVAKSTAAYVLSRSSTHKVSRATQQKVLAAAQDLGYVPNRMAAGLKTGRSGLIGLYFGHVEPPHTEFAHGFDTHFANFFGGVTAACLRHDVFPVMLVHEAETPESDGARIQRMLHAGIDAIVAYLAGPEANLALKDLADQGIPVVRVFCEEFGREPELPTIDVDNALMGEMGADYLLARGYRDIVAVRGPDESAPVLAREQGFRRAMERAGLAPRVVVLPSRYHFPFAQFHESSYGIINGIHADAVFAMNAGATLLASGAFARRERWAPEECALIGVDVAATPDFRSITHFTAPWDTLGRRAVDLVCQAVDEGRSIPVHQSPIAPHRVDGETCPDRRVAVT